MTGSYFDERYPHGPLRDVRLHLIAEFPDELVRDHKDEDLCAFDCVCDVWNSDLVGHGGQRLYLNHVSDHREPKCGTRDMSEFKYVQSLLCNNVCLAFYLGEIALH